MASVRFTFTLHPVTDSKVVTWLMSQPNTSAAVREALKAYVEKPTPAELGTKLDEILNAIQSARLMTPMPQQEPQEGGEPQAAIEGFDRMVEKFKTG